MGEAIRQGAVCFLNKKASLSDQRKRKYLLQEIGIAEIDDPEMMIASQSFERAFGKELPV